MPKPEKSKLHELLENPHTNARDVQSLIDMYPDAVMEIGRDGMLPLHTAIMHQATVRVIKVLLKADPSAAEKTFRSYGYEDDFEDMLPLHIAITETTSCSLGVVKALLYANPKGAEARIRGKLPLGLSLTTDGVSDYVVLALLAAYPDAAKVTLSIESDVVILPLHFAMEEKRSELVVKALINAHPGAAKEMNPDTKNLPLHDAIYTGKSKEILLLLFNAYPQAAKKKLKDGWLPIEACGRNIASEDLMLALLEADMPLRRDGTPVEHSGSWTACVAAKNESAAGAVRRILSPVSEGGGGYWAHIHALADICDAEGRSALGLATTGPRAAIYEYLLFCRRYKLQTGAPEHRTPTSMVLRAQDLDEQADYGDIFDRADKDKNGQLDRHELLGSIGLDPKLFLKGSDESTISKEDFVGICKRQLGDGPRNVVIKLMQKKDQWERECRARREHNLDPKYVVSMLPNVPSETDIAEAVKKGDGGLETIVQKFLDGIEPGKYAIVMDAADRNLHQIFYQEQPTIDVVRDILRQVFEAVKHLHEKKLMHGDLKMLNVVRSRIDNRLRLIDMDASAKIVRIGCEGESFAGAKFSSAILPPEMIERIETEQQLGEFNKYWESENDKYLVAKVAPKLYKEQGIVKARYVVKSFRTKRGKPVYEGLPYDMVKASENIDIWALGVLAFTLLTGETLIPSTRDDDCASGAAMHVLYSWGKQPGVLMELFKKIHDDSARDLVQQLLQYEPKNRPTVASLLEKHPFFHPERDNKEIGDRLERFEKNQESQVKQLEIMNASIAMMKKMGDESKAELFHTRHVLLKAIFDATEVKIPTTFIVLNNKLPPKPSDETVTKILDIVAAEDGSGVRFQTEHVSLALSADGADINLEGDLKKHYNLGLKWVKRIKIVGSEVAAFKAAETDQQKAVAACNVVEESFNIINEEIKDIIVENEMYLYLIDELTGEPVRAEGWPIIITTPSKIVPKLLPLMQVGMRAMSIYNGAAGVARMFGYPVPIVPKAWSKGAQESVELLKQESSVEDFGVVHAKVKKGTEMKESVRGASLREFMDFMSKNDPGLKYGKSGDFAGLQRIGDPEDGTALWTTLTDPIAIENALKERANQREEEQLKHNEHIQNMAKVEVETVTTAAAKEAAPAAVAAGNTCCKVDTTAAAKEVFSAVTASNICCTIM